MFRKKVFITIFLILFFVSVASFFIYSANLKEEEKEEVQVEVNTTSQTKISLVMVGDALIHSSVYNDAYDNGVYDFTSILEYIKPIVSNYDLAFYNQETILGGTSIGLSDYPSFNTPWEFGDAMLDAGFNIVNLATNHTLDRGTTGVEKSCEYWNSKKDEILFAGSYCNEEDADEIKIFEKNDITYTLLSYTYGTNGISVPEGKEYMVSLYSDEKAKSDIEKVRDKVDLLLVSMHWGLEYQTVPTSEQQRQAQYLADLGVDIVIGTHPHVIEPVTFIDDTLVIYSLGNFISAQQTNNDYNTMVELMTSIDIVKTTKNGTSEIELTNLNNELLYNYYKTGNGWYDFKVIPFSQMNETYNSDYQRLYEKYSSIVKMYDESIPVEPISN